MKKVSSEDLVNWWLNKYHNTTLDQVKKDHPEWSENPDKHTRDFYNTYRVTQEQCDEWEVWAKDYTRKVTKVSKKVLEQSWWSVYLNCSPNIIKDE